MQKNNASASVGALLFAPPNVGNSAFVRAFNSQVNARSLRFQNDVVPQLPCVPTMVACSAGVLMPTNQPGNVSLWKYSSVGGALPIKGSDMPVQASAWSAFTTISLCYPQAFLSATHSCSYECFTSKFVTGSNSRCLLQTPSNSTLLGEYTNCSHFPITGYPLKSSS